MYNIHGLCHGQYVPFVLLGMSESIYRSMWNAIISLYERGNLTHEPSYYFEVAMQCVQCLRMFTNSEYDQEIPQSQTADKSVVPRGRATQQARDTRKTNKANHPAHPSPSR